MKKIAIAPLSGEDEAEWRPLFEAYSRFYEVEPSAEKSRRVWSWLMDPSHMLEGLGAKLNGRLVGIAHIRPVPRTLSGGTGGFLDDLFVDPDARGHKVGEKLLEAIAELAALRGWTNVRWITADDNYRARTLYDRVAKKALWNTYDMPPKSG